jgi:hypothetical protein
MSYPFLFFHRLKINHTDSEEEYTFDLKNGAVMNTIPLVFLPLFSSIIAESSVRALIIAKIELNFFLSSEKSANALQASAYDFISFVEQLVGVCCQRRIVRHEIRFGQGLNFS